MKVFLPSSLSLHCINYNKRLFGTYDGRLVLENLTKPTKENALWIVKYYDSLWFLINQTSSICLVFNTKDKLIYRLEENGSKSNESLEVQVDDHLLVRLSSTTSENKLSLELIDENDHEHRTSPIFFVREGFDQMFRDIDPDSLYNHFTVIKTVADVSNNDYDYTVIGSSFCALAFIHRILEKNSEAKILVLEKGFKYLSQHHQHCDTSSSPGGVELRSWTISQEMESNEFLKDVHGPIPIFGGRSTYWSGWSPIPTPKELEDWPEDLKTALQEKYFGLAREFLSVVPANEIKANENNHLIYDAFQSRLKERLDSAAGIESIDQILHAPLAMGNDRSIKFSTPEMLLSMTNVTFVFDCTIEKILHDGNKAIALQTNQNTTLALKNSKLILAMSTLPATTLVLNSFDCAEFPQLSNVGKRFSAHFVSSVIGRVPRESLSIGDNNPDIELGAVYITGMKHQAQYHLQLSGVAYRQCQNNNHIHDICKKYSANSIPKDCIDEYQDFIVVSCSTLGELDYKNKSNHFDLSNSSRDLTTNGQLSFCLNEQDKQLWNLMDNVTFQIMEKLSSTSTSNQLQYWHENDKMWKTESPPVEQIRKKRLVHDSSTMWIGDRDDTEAPVTYDYRLRGVDNVYITGGALWPTGGSWNPVITIVAMGMHLADTIYQSEYQIV